MPMVEPEPIGGERTKGPLETLTVQQVGADLLKEPFFLVQVEGRERCAAAPRRNSWPTCN
jgi:hypothetical protein